MQELGGYSEGEGKEGNDVSIHLGNKRGRPRGGKKKKKKA